MSRKPRPVRALVDGTVYPSIKAAAAEHDVLPGNIIAAMQRGIRCRGTHWEYVDGQPTATYRTRRSDARVPRPVYREDGMRFDSVRQAATAHKTTPDRIYSAISDGIRHRGYYWTYQPPVRSRLALEVMGAARAGAN